MVGENDFPLLPKLTFFSRVNSSRHDTCLTFPVKVEKYTMLWLDEPYHLLQRFRIAPKFNVVEIQIRCVIFGNAFAYLSVRFVAALQRAGIAVA